MTNINQMIDISQYCKKYGEIFSTPKFRHIYKCLMCTDPKNNEIWNPYITSDVNKFWKHIERSHNGNLTKSSNQIVTTEKNGPEAKKAKVPNVIVIDDDDDDNDNDDEHRANDVTEETHTARKAETTKAHKDDENSNFRENLKNKPAPTNIRCNATQSVSTNQPIKRVYNTEQEQSNDIKVEDEILLTPYCSYEFGNDSKNQEHAMFDKPTEQSFGQESTPWARVTNEQFGFELNIEMEKNTELANGTVSANVNRSDSLYEEKVDLNKFMMEKKIIDPPVDGDRVTSMKGIEQFLSYYDNNAILLSDDDDEADEVDEDIEMTTDAKGDTAQSSAQVANSDTIRFKCLMCPKKNSTKTEKSMLKHMRKKHAIDNIEHAIKYIPKTVACKFCGYEYMEKYLGQHVKKVHPAEYVDGRRSRKIIRNMDSLPWQNVLEIRDSLRGKISQKEHQALCYFSMLFKMQQARDKTTTTNQSQKKSVMVPYAV